MDKIKEILPNLVMTLLATTIVGAFVGYMTVNTVLSQLETRVQRNETDIHSLVKTVEKARIETQLVNDRLIRIEVRLDMLLEQQRAQQGPFTPLSPK